MKDITLVSVNWNQKKAMEIMLKSYINFHHSNEKLNLLLFDNGSTDGSKEWLINNKIPFISHPENIGHENAINYIYPLIKTKYVLIVDTDIIFLKNIKDAYIDKFSEKVKLIGDYITQHTPPLIPRIAAWFFFFDIESMRNKGVNIFRNSENWIYDVGSWYTEQVLENGFELYKIERQTEIEKENTDIYGMIYDTHIHLGKMSWDLSAHSDRIEEVEKRRAFIESFNKYDNIHTENKFI